MVILFIERHKLSSLTSQKKVERKVSNICTNYSGHYFFDEYAMQLSETIFQQVCF